jgi:hypothetical protein
MPRLDLCIAGDEEFVMWISHQEAVAMYANFCRAHYGFNAYQMVMKRATELGQNGDLEGEKVWNEVAAEIQKAPQQVRALFA